MSRRAAPQLGVDRMVSISWSGEPAVKPPARQGRASARGLEGRPTLQHPHASDQTGWKSRCRASFSLAIKHGIYRKHGTFWRDNAVARPEILIDDLADVNPAKSRGKLRSPGVAVMPG